MDDKIIEFSKNDPRVTFDYIINDRIHLFKALPNNECNKIIIYCHGLGSNKTCVTRFYEKLLDNNLGIYALDLPGHGEDKTDFKDFDLELCLSYLEKTIEHVKEENMNSKVYLFACSYGGFVTLNKLMKDNNVKGTILMCPAFNFYNILKRKTNIEDNYFDEKEYLELYNNIKIYKKAFVEFKEGNELIKNCRFSNISIIQGNNDKTVLLDDIKIFCNQNNLNLKLIKDGKHELYGYDDEIVDFILEQCNISKQK